MCGSPTFSFRVDVLDAVTAFFAFVIMSGKRFSTPLVAFLTASSSKASDRKKVARDPVGGDTVETLERFQTAEHVRPINTGRASERGPAHQRLGFEPRTINVHMTRLQSIFDAARREGLMQRSPVSDAKRPKVARRPKWTILTPVEIAAVMKAFDKLIAEAETDAERAWRRTAKAMTVTT
jgi:hypothetical protein